MVCQQVGLLLRALGGIGVQNLVGVIQMELHLKYCVCLVPVGPLSGIRASLLHPRFPCRLEFGDVILSQESVALVPVGRQRRQIRPHFARQRRLDIHFLRIGEESKKLIELALRKWIVLVIVALRAPHGEAEICRPERRSPVYQLLIAELLDVDSVLSVCNGVALKSSRHLLLNSCVRQQVTGNLFQEELVERHVAIQRVDHPMAITPCMWSYVVLLVTIAVGVAGQIEPVPSPLFPIMLRFQQPVDDALICIRPAIGKKLFHLGGRWEAVPSDRASRAEAASSCPLPEKA